MTTQFGKFELLRFLQAIRPDTAVSQNPDHCGGGWPGLERLRDVVVKWALHVAVFWWMIAASHVVAEEVVSEFDGPETSWKVFLRPQDPRVSLHERRRGAGKFGGAEVIRVSAIRENSPMRLEHPVPPATVLDELELSLWFKSNHDGFELKARITLPDVLDPETKSPLVLYVTGDKYQTVDKWQLLKCRTSDRAVDDQLRLLRAKIRQMSINPKSKFVDRVIVAGRLPPGETEILFDRLTANPLVRFQADDDEPDSVPVKPVNESVRDSSHGESRPSVPVKFRLNRLEVEGRKFFPRMVTYHHERPEVLTEAGMNVAWVDDYENINATGPLRRHGLWVTAAPPYAKGMDGEPLDSDDASLLPFQANTSSVLFWMLGARMSTDARPRLTSWTNQIRNADRRFNKRPIAADVLENERLCSRHVDLLGISRHVMNSSCSMSDYRDWLIQRRDQALPDTFCFTWIQTEPVPSLTDLSRRVDSPPMLEPEQIRLQVYAALAAGCRGIGYWTTTPLDEDTPAARERMLILTQLNRELDLFEPWITSGGAPQLISFSVEAGRSDYSGNSASPANANTTAAKTPVGKLASFGKNLPTNSKTRPVKPPERELHAALIRSEQGALLLPMWLEDSSQFVPGPMAARNISIIVPGGGETAAAWEITTTGQLRNLDRGLVAGGVQIKLPRLDQTAAILITTNYSSVEQLNQKILAIQDQSAHTLVELAKLKLERVKQVDQALQDLGVERRDGWMWLGEAKINLDKAEIALKNQQFVDARQFAAEALIFGRMLQRNHWDHTVRRLSSPTSNPWAVSFQSLPEYWRLSRQIEGVGSLETMENLLPSGEFEDRNTLIAEHWKHEQALVETVESGAELYESAKQGKFCLRLTALPTDPAVAPTIVSKPPVTLISPGIVVHTGQIVRITGWTKIPVNLAGSIDGALIYDSVLGKPGAIRLKASHDWQKFELVRPVSESQDMTLTIALHGLGELLVDDVRITAFEPSQAIAAPAPNKSALAPAKYSPLDIRRLNPLPKRK